MLSFHSYKYYILLSLNCNLPKDFNRNTFIVAEIIVVLQQKEENHYINYLIYG